MDYVYPSIFFSYFLFFLLLFGALFFFIRSFRHGYWGKGSEDPKYRMLEDERNSEACAIRAATVRERSDGSGRRQPAC